MANGIAAKPTVFEGVEFRSKSEAIFAVAVNSIRNTVWQYEPHLEGFSFDVDFMLLCANARNVKTFLIEYKPSLPSESFIAKCVASFSKFMDSHCWQSELCKGFWIIYGSPFADCKLESIAVHEFLGHSYGTDPATILQESFVEAKNFRFDLA